MPPDVFLLKSCAKAVAEGPGTIASKVKAGLKTIHEPEGPIARAITIFPSLGEKIEVHGELGVIGELHLSGAEESDSSLLSLEIPTLGHRETRLEGTEALKVGLVSLIGVAITFEIVALKKAKIVDVERAIKIIDRKLVLFAALGAVHDVGEAPMPLISFGIAGETLKVNN